jgi:hypothetical protein
MNVCIFKIKNFSIHNLYFQLYRFRRKLSKSYFIPYVCCADKIRLYLLIVNMSLSVVSLILKCNINILILFYEHIVFFFFYKVFISNSVLSLINGLLKWLDPQFPDSGSTSGPSHTLEFFCENSDGRSSWLKSVTQLSSSDFDYL